jgi:hypothetical protein
MGKVFFARNITGVKLAFSNISIKKAIDNLNVSQLSGNFTLCEYIKVSKPRIVKSEIASLIYDRRINKDLYNLDESEIFRICSLFSKKYSKYDDESDSVSEYERDLEEDKKYILERRQ